MTWSIVMMQLPVFCLTEGSCFVPNCIMESFDYLLIVSCYCLTFQYVSIMHNSMDIAKRSITLVLLRTGCAFSVWGAQDASIEITVLFFVGHSQTPMTHILLLRCSETQDQCWQCPTCPDAIFTF